MIDNASKHGTINKCVSCGKDFTAERPCCCDWRTTQSGDHVDGTCVVCCAKNRVRPVKQDGCGGYERAGCE